MAPHRRPIGKTASWALQQQTQLGEEVRALLDQGLFATLLARAPARPRSPPSRRACLYAREPGLASQLAGALAALSQAQASAQGDLAALRGELEAWAQDIIGSLRQSAAAPRPMDRQRRRCWSVSPPSLSAGTRGA